MAAAQGRARTLVEQHGIRIVEPSPDELEATRQAMTMHQEEVARLSRISPEMVAAVSADLIAG
jgi:hypothetical protein